MYGQFMTLWHRYVATFLRGRAACLRHSPKYDHIDFESIDFCVDPLRRRQPGTFQSESRCFTPKLRLDIFMGEAAGFEPAIAVCKSRQRRAVARRKE
jgi:hypothetical protein